MKKILFAAGCCLVISSASPQSGSQTRTSSNIIPVSSSTQWVNRSPAAFAQNDNVYGYTKTTIGTVGVWPDHFNFSIPAGAQIDRIRATVRKFKKGKGEVRDAAGLTGFARNSCCLYGQSFNNPNPWSTTEQEVIYEQPGTGVDASGNSYTWTAADVNDPVFAFTNSATITRVRGQGAAIYYDEISVTVYYTETAARTIQPVVKSMIADHLIYPNPATDQATISFYSRKSGNTNFALYNALGVAVGKYNFGYIAAGMYYRRAIRLTGLPAGIYRYQLLEGNEVRGGLLVVQ